MDPRWSLGSVAVDGIGPGLRDARVWGQRPNVDGCLRFSRVARTFGELQSITDHRRRSWTSVAHLRRCAKALETVSCRDSWEFAAIRLLGDDQFLCRWNGYICLLRLAPIDNTTFGNRANLNGNGRTPLNHSSHSRTKSLSTNPNEFSQTLRSPLSNSFLPQRSMFPSPESPDSPRLKSFASPQSVSAPDMQPRSLSPGQPSTSRRHTHNRIHSRNLFVFFPLPGTLPQPTIEEDSVDMPAPVTTIRERLGNDGLRAGFRFGGAPSTLPSLLHLHLDLVLLGGSPSQTLNVP